MKANRTVSLAPMAGFTDIPFRCLCHDFGADYTVTEMVSAVAVCFGDAKTRTLADIGENEGPVVLQLFGHDPDTVSRAVGILYEDMRIKPAGIEINMGCPVKKIVNNGEGSALMKNIPLACEIITKTAHTCDNLGIPLGVKIRAGWSRDSINAPEFAAAVANAGADVITVHGRTRDMMYAPSSDNEVIKRVRDILPPAKTVIGNGDVTDLDSALRMMKETGADGIAIGRAALGNPWVFREIKEGKKHISSKKERIDTALYLLEEIVKEKGENAGIREARGRVAHFIRTLPGSAKARDEINHAETLEKFRSIMVSLSES